MTRIAIALVIMLAAFATAAQADPILYLDAVQSVNGVPLDGYAAVWFHLDNRTGTQDITNVRFRMEIHNGVGLGGLGGWGPDNPECPWYGIGYQQGYRQVVDNVMYVQGIVGYNTPDGALWGPCFTGYYQPAHPLYSEDEMENWFELRDVVPAGLIWDHMVKLIGWDGETPELFSVATGELTSDQVVAPVFDTNPEPNAVPEPATLGLLTCGALALLRRRKK